MLYEMTSGKQPFRGETTADTVANIIHREPVSVSSLLTDGQELDAIISHALAKDADARYQTAKELVDDLKQLQRRLEFAVEGKTSEARTVVLDAAVRVNPQPTSGASGKTNVTPGPVVSNEPRAAIAAQDINGSTSAASRARRAGFWAALLIVALLATAFGGYRYFAHRSSDRINSIAVMPFVNASGNSDVDYLSDGLTDSLIFRFSQLANVKVSPTSSVMRFKNTVKDVADVAKELNVDAVLTGRLMRAGDELSISVQLVDARTQKLVWAEQYDRKMADLLATQREIATTLTQKMQLQLAGDELGLAKKYTSSNEAYQLYLKGRFHYARRNKEDMLKAIEAYQQAIQIDPNFALAYASTAEVYNSMGKNPDVVPRDCVPLAKQAALRALEIDPLLPQAHSALGDSLALYDWDWAESERHFKKALEPLSLINNSVLTTAYMYNRQYEKALAQARTAYDLDPGFPLARVWLGFALIANGKYDEAISSIGQVSPESPFGWMSTVVLAHAYARHATFALIIWRVSTPRSETRIKRLPNSKNRSQKRIVSSAGWWSILRWTRCVPIRDSRIC